MDRPIAALEITSKAAKLIVGYVIDDEVCVVYSSMLPLEGAIIDGEIRDFEKVSDVLKTLANIKDESKKLKINISEVVLGLPPIGLEVYQNDKVTNVVSDDGRISRIDITNVISLVKKEQVKTVDKIVDIIPDVFILDHDQVFYTPPIGKVSNSLALNAKVHTLPKNIIDGYLKVCENASLRVKRMMVTPYALGELLKTYKDIPDHYLLLDMGANLTTISLMGNKSRLFASTYIAKGGDDLTRFLADKFHLDFKVANDLKELYGDDLSPVSPDISILENEPNKALYLKDFKEAVETWLSAYTNDIKLALNVLLKEYDERYYLLPLLLSGGTSLLNGIELYFSKVFKDNAIKAIVPTSLGARDPSYFNCLSLIKAASIYRGTLEDERIRVSPLNRKGNENKSYSEMEDEL